MAGADWQREGIIVTSESKVAFRRVVSTLSSECRSCCCCSFDGRDVELVGDGGRRPLSAEEIRWTPASVMVDSLL